MRHWHQHLNIRRRVHCATKLACQMAIWILMITTRIYSIVMAISWEIHPLVRYILIHITFKYVSTVNTSLFFLSPTLIAFSPSFFVILHLFINKTSLFIYLSRYEVFSFDYGKRKNEIPNKIFKFIDVIPLAYK